MDGSPIDDSLQMQILGMIRRKMKSLCADVFTKLWANVLAATQSTLGIKS